MAYAESEARAGKKHQYRRDQGHKFCYGKKSRYNHGAQKIHYIISCKKLSGTKLNYDSQRNNNQEYIRFV